MPRQVEIIIPHDLTGAEVRTRIDEGFGRIKTAMTGGILFKFTEDWQGDQMRFTAKGMGQTITGEIDIFERHVRITAVLPGLLAGIAEAITGRVKKEGTILLEKR